MSDTTILKQGRELQLRMTDGLSEEQLLTVPPGHRNNILWNLGHIVAIHQILTYKLSGLPFQTPDSMIEQFGNGSSPADWKIRPDIGLIRQAMLETPDLFEADLKAGRFQDFMPITTSTGVQIDSFERAIAFNSFHEGLHLGVIMSLKKLV